MVDSQQQREAGTLRLQVFLSRSGITSRRQAMTLIQRGDVSVNGKTVSEPSFPVHGGEDVRVKGKRIAAPQYQYLMLNKPSGYVTTKRDPFAERTVYDLLPKTLSGVKPVGRLDKNTEGLLLLTNDGKIIQRLTHPRYNIEKTYLVRIKTLFKFEDRKKIEGGLFIDHKKTAPAKIESIQNKSGSSQLTLVIHEGRKRQVRRMFAQLGYKVVYLKRMRQGPVKLGRLPLGKFRFLADGEIKALRAI